MAAAPPPPPNFERLGPVTIRSPVVFAVPHAGRDYPAALLARSRLPVSRLQALEDRRVDQVAAAAALDRNTIIVARRARAWIDLNRDPREIDPAMTDPEPQAADVTRTAKLRGGLGLIPRMLAGAGEIHRGRLPLAEVEARIATDHLPYHAAIAAALAAAHARFGVALLVDLHSMPPLAAASGSAAARIVVGDRFGHSADARFTEAALAIAAAAGLSPALNTPYSGGYTLDRHGRAAAGIHAIQIELDRSLYLDAALDLPGEGMGRTARWLAAVAAALAAECAVSPRAIAAE